tara:strand:- start:1100 stop:1519 length:420 start_codon:yes stop_codon:yes gene_type:complete
MDIEQLNYNFGDITEKTFKDIKDERKSESINLKPEMFDYMIGDNSSLRYDYILSLDDKQEKINEMTKLISEILPVGFPDEFYDWYSRECLGLQYNKYELKDMKRKYKIEKKREIQKKKNEDKLISKRLKYTKKKVVLEF